MLAIAVCYQRLNLWDQNCGGPYVWVARAISPVCRLPGRVVDVGRVRAWIGEQHPAARTCAAVVHRARHLGHGRKRDHRNLFGLILTAIAAVGIRPRPGSNWPSPRSNMWCSSSSVSIAFWAVFVRTSGRDRPSQPELAAPERCRRQGEPGRRHAHCHLPLHRLGRHDLHQRGDNTTSAPIPERRRSSRSHPWPRVLPGSSSAFRGWFLPNQLQAHATDALPIIAQSLVGSSWAKFMVLAVVLSVLGTNVGYHRVDQPGDVLDGDRPPAPESRSHGCTLGFGPRCSRLHFWGLLMVVVADLYVLSSSLANAFNDVVNAERSPSPSSTSSPPWRRRSGTTGPSCEEPGRPGPGGDLPPVRSGRARLGAGKSIPAARVDRPKWTVAGVGLLGVVLMADQRLDPALTLLRHSPILIRLRRVLTLSGIEPAI
jgi:hypothetical protein